jgi:hypothetical protein
MRIHFRPLHPVSDESEPMRANVLLSRWLAKQRAEAIEELTRTRRINSRQADHLKRQYATPQRTALALSRGTDDGFEAALNVFGGSANRSNVNPLLADADRRAREAAPMKKAR